MPLYQKARKLNKYGSPKIIAENLGINVIRIPLKSIKGAAVSAGKTRLIFIDSNLSDIEQEIVCGHELGHFYLHPASNFVFVLQNTLFKDKHEYQANRFACELMLGEKTEEYKYLVSELCSKGKLDRLAQFISFVLNSEQGDDP